MGVKQSSWRSVLSPRLSSPALSPITAANLTARFLHSPPLTFSHYHLSIFHCCSLPHLSASLPCHLSILTFTYFFFLPSVRVPPCEADMWAVLRRWNSEISSSSRRRSSSTRRFSSPCSRFILSNRCCSCRTVKRRRWFKYLRTENILKSLQDRGKPVAKRCIYDSVGTWTRQIFVIIGLGKWLANLLTLPMVGVICPFPSKLFRQE